MFEMNPKSTELTLRYSNLRFEDDTFRDDKLGRKSEVNNIKNILLNVDPPFTIALDSQWGTGKTTFIKMLKNEIEKEKGHITIYHNAWENDFSDDPLIALLSDFEKETTEDDPKIWDNIKKASGFLARKGIPVGLRLLTAGIISTDKKDIDAILNLGDSIQENTLTNLAEELGKDAITNFNQSKSQIDSFKASVNQLIKKYNRVIFFVDELDRCRPNYAIELLERIKHLFCIEGLIFVLSIDKKELGFSVESVNGVGTDKSGYLRRFFDAEYTLKNPPKTIFIISLLKRSGIKNICDRFDQDGMQPTRIISSIEEIRDTLNFITLFFNLGLREIQQIVNRLKLTLLCINLGSNVFLPTFIVFLIYLRESQTELFNRLKRNEIGVTELLKHFDIVNYNSEKFLEKDLSVIRVCAYFHCALADLNPSPFEKFKLWVSDLGRGIYNNGGQDNKRAIYYSLSSCMDKWNLCRDLSKLIEKVEFSDSFEI